MSKAFKCDRCCTCFVPEDICGEGQFTSIPEIFTQNSTDFIINKITFRKESINLCENCTQEFMEWIAHLGYVKPFSECDGDNSYENKDFIRNKKQKEG